jgi:hypothetical protein
VRATHPVSDELPDPPLFWIEDYPAFAEELGLAEATSKSGNPPSSEAFSRSSRGIGWRGRGFDTALILIDSYTDSRGIYTPMTRGRHSNHAYVVIEDNQTAIDVLAQAVTRDWIDQPAIARQTHLEPHRYRQLSDANDEDEFDKLEQHVRSLIEDRRAWTRELERSKGLRFAGRS